MKRLMLGKVNFRNMTNNIILNKIEIDGDLIRYRFTVSDELQIYFNSNELFIDYDESLSSVPLSVLTIPFAAIFSIFSWLFDVSLWVDEIDETYFYSLKQLKVAYQEAHYTYPFKGRFIPSKIVVNELPMGQHGLLLFGGGVDCHSSFLRNKEIIREIVNINGWIKEKNESNKVDDSDKEMTLDFARLMGVDAKHIRSNFASLLNLREIDRVLLKKVKTGYWYGFLHAMAFIGIAIPLAYMRNYSFVYIASSNSKGQNNVCSSDVTTDSLHKYCTNGLTIHDGYELNRQEKIQLIVDYKRKIGHPYYLHVCSFNDHNCCQCEKCFRTVTSLIAENEDPRDYGFLIEGSMTDYWKTIMARRLGLWGISMEQRIYWPYTKERMREKYEQIEDKEFVDWFLSFDFISEQKKARLRYYRENFWAIVKRKLRVRR